MKIYQDEINAGLESVINSAKSVNLSGPLNVVARQKSFLAKLMAALTDQELINNLKQTDLAVITSILVSTGWNLNDDIFLPNEIYAARSTPEHKPINIDHDETNIIGHMVKSKIVDKNGNELDIKDESELPDKFDIEVIGVLYRLLPALSETVAEIIEDAKNGKRFVSMECFFDDFSYGVQDRSTKETQIIDRSNSTAFLTRHLKVYGGTGEFENKKIGRVLKNLFFSGKGIVENPANPESVIKDIKTAANLDERVVMDNKEMDQMKAQIDEITKQLSEKDAKIAEISVTNEKLVAEVKTLTDIVSENEKKASEYIAQINKQNETQDIWEQKITEQEMKLNEVKVERDTVKAELDKIHKAEKGKVRLAEITKFKKFNDEAAEMAALAEMTDETFALILKYAQTETVAKAPVTEETKENKTEAEEKEIEEILDTAKEISEANLNIGVDNNSERDFETKITMAQMLLGRSEKK